MAFYTCPRNYFADADDLEERITRICAIIVAMEGAVLDAAAGQETSEYRLDDGQTRITNVTRSMDELVNGILKLEKLKNYYVNQLNGHGVKLVDLEANKYKTRYGTI